jgi:hypothetical protein
VLLGASSPSRTLTFANDGPDTATEATVLVAGDIAEFTLDRDTCSGSTLAVDATCTITARFAPRTAGRYELSLAVAGAESDEIEWSPTLFGVGAQPAGGGSPLAPPPSSAQTTAPQRAPAATLKRAGAPRVRRHGRRATLDTGWRVACHAGPAPCTAAVTVSTVTTRTRKSTVLAHAVDSVPAGAERKLVLDLSRTGASALRRRSGLSAALDVTVTQTGASATIAHAPLRLRWPRRG